MAIAVAPNSPSADELQPPTHLITLRDGRRLAYVERGSADGFPVFHHHGMPGSRLQHEADESMYRSLGMRVVTPDRPGYGLSDPHHEGTLLDWAEDVRQLADALGIHRFGITALSGGGIYALACAAVLPDRLSAIVVTGCPAPMQIPHAFAGMRFLTRAAVHAARWAPGFLEAIADPASRFVARHPRFFYDHLNRDKPPADRRWLHMPMVASGEIEDIREALSRGASGYGRDLELLARPWGFALKAITCPVSLWHGELDTVIPIRHGRYLAAAIPGARLHVCPGEAHLLLWNHIREILLEAAGREATPS